MGPWLLARIVSSLSIQSFWSLSFSHPSLSSPSSSSSLPSSVQHLNTTLSCTRWPHIETSWGVRTKWSILISIAANSRATAHIHQTAITSLAFEELESQRLTWLLHVEGILELIASHDDRVWGTPNRQPTTNPTDSRHLGAVGGVTILLSCLIVFL